MPLFTSATRPTPTTPNGNQTGWTDDKSGQRRKIFWDEEDRIRAIQDNGATFHYVYDAQGKECSKDIPRARTCM
jgi:hypothetical protein